jgi:uncharacterized protein YkwD
MIDRMFCKKTEKTGPSHPAVSAAGRKLAFMLLVCLLALPLLGMHSGRFTGNSSAAKPTKTPKNSSVSSSGSAYDVIAAVNQVRAANGLSPFQVNAALMAAAQGHSQYQASSGSISHTGSGGSSPQSRASAAGYSGSVIENIYAGLNASPQQAVSWWQGDSLHLNTLLSTNHTDAGAGVATSGGVVYYTLDVGSGTGGSSGSSGAAVPVASGAAGLAPATLVAFSPVLIASPNPDGSIVHVVQPGQTLWTIAASYKIALSDLLQLNGFTNNTFIYPGNKILIKPAGAVAAIGTGTPGIPDSTGAATRLPKTPAGSLPEIKTSTQIASNVPAGSTTPAGLTATPPLPQPRPASNSPDPLLLVVAGLVLGGTGLLVAGNILKRGAS